MGKFGEAAVEKREKKNRKALSSSRLHWCLVLASVSDDWVVVSFFFFRETSVIVMATFVCLFLVLLHC